MKKCKKISSLLLIAIIGLSLSFTACNDDDDENNDSATGTATVGENTVSFSQGVLEYYGSYQTGADLYQYTIALFSSGLTYQSQSGSGDIMLFDVYTNSSTFEGGTFEFTNYSPEAGKTNTVTLMLNLTASDFTAEHMYRATGDGEINITKNGSTYDISFTLSVLEIDQETYNPIGEEQTLTGNYSGSLSYYDQSGQTMKNNSRFILSPK